ncbi:uncharacterized protein LOC135257470 isoform X2 [Anguilla rostrata]|uniref:uncharacterized protein LOC135257470 isoform X2 n=1 Tax=Anguilla rostrata TaxID=7938 RepID=UPI0030D3EB1F
MLQGNCMFFTEETSTLRMKGVTVILLTAVLALGRCEHHEHTLENVALKGKAVQSSTYGSAYARRAIDGNRDGDYYHGSCSHTEGETNPWWRVDLLGVHRVSSVIISNRGDGFSERLNDAEIHIGNSLENNGNDNPTCAVISTIPPWEPVSFNCSGMVGRYINVLLRGYTQFLTLCEVEVYASPAEDIGIASTLGPSITQKGNVALRKKTRQSSSKSRGRASKAVDGKRSTRFQMGSCTQTRTEADPWWRVDLEKAYNVTSVTITSREDCCAEMIDGAQLRIGDSLENKGNNNPICTVISSFPAWETLTFQCHGMMGRYVNIFLPGCDKYLTLCEVEVHAEPDPVSLPEVTTDGPPLVTEPDSSEEFEEILSIAFDFMQSIQQLFGTIYPDSTQATEYLKENVLLAFAEEDEVTQDRQCTASRTVQENLATGGQTTQSTRWDDFGDATNAIDRNRQGVYLKGSCSHTKGETNPWWRVDLLKSYNITSVAVSNREDCCSERINGAEIHVGDSLENNGNDNPVCAVIPYIPSGQTRTYQCNGMVGRYVSILLPGKSKYLTLCEVEVNGNAIE